jgi:peptidoglycan/xylan/chitin deacetylase (PgdA/CDA1 family)
MTWAQCRELEAIGWEIGSHTVSHPRLTTLDDETLADELSRSKRECERAMGVECKTLAYPYGDEDLRVEAATAAAGYERAAALPSPVLHSPKPHSWPRLGVYGPDDMTRFKRKISPALRRLRSRQAWRLVQARHLMRRRCDAS